MTKITLDLNRGIPFNLYEDELLGAVLLSLFCDARGTEPDGSASTAETQTTVCLGCHVGGARQHWLMWLMCLPMLVLVGALMATGGLGLGGLLYALACLGMMGAMMLWMNHGSHGGHKH